MRAGRELRGAVSRARARPAAWLPLTLLGGIAVALLITLLLVTGEGEVEGSPTELDERLSSLDVVLASENLSVMVEERRRQMVEALLPGQEENLVELLRMQAQAAHLELGPVSVEPGPRDGLVRAVDVQLDLEGAAYDLPIFVDGVFRQSRVLEVRSVSVESLVPMGTRVRSRIQARFFRPATIGADEVRPLIEARMPDANRGAFAAAAMADAAWLVAADAFQDSLPDMEQRAQENRRLVIRTLPRLVRRLPSSPHDWVGATFDHRGAHVATDGP